MTRFGKSELAGFRETLTEPGPAGQGGAVEWGASGRPQAIAAGMDGRLPDVVLITRNRRNGLLETLRKLTTLEDQPRVIVVDNGSTDGSAGEVSARFPQVVVVRLAVNIGAAARNVGVEMARTAAVAFADDDSWWENGSLREAADVFESRPRLGLLAAAIRVHPGGVLDPTCALMERSPLEEVGPGIRGVLGFLACGAIVRRSAFVGVGGFDVRFGVGGEEELLALDMVSAGWELGYCGRLTAHHEPSPVRDLSARKVSEERNRLWMSWLRRPVRLAVARSGEALLGGRGRSGVLGALAAGKGMGAVLRERTPLAPEVEVRARAVGL
ncbi:MAG: glycosyltransferase [Actinomycetota bacterium]|nr:glycosyltransferase [Actinomycetota bacterium]